MPKYCPINVLCSVGVMRIEGGEMDENEEVDTRLRKTMQLIELIGLYRELAMMARDVGEFLGRCAETIWSNGDEDLVEWNKRKGDRMYQLGEVYEGEVIELKRHVHELVETLDELLNLCIN